MSQKVDSGHNSVKQIVDIHKTNEQLSEQLLAKVEQNKKLDQDLESQRTAYEVLLDQLSKLEYSETTLMDQVKELEATIEEMQADNKKSSGISRASIGSDDEYQTVSEMKDHLNHARQILIQFIVKVPFR
jgi:predicted nuclease with TOPRIM domain